MTDPIDKVTLRINGKGILNAKEYDVSIGYFTTPSVFSLTVGSNKTSLDLMREVPPGALFALEINEVAQFVGYIDGFERLGGGATEIALTGRDVMSQLIRDHIEHERSFNNATFEDLALAAILGSGIQEPTLFYDMAAARAAVTGTPVVKDVRVVGKAVSDPVTGTPIEAKPQRLGIVAVDSRVGPVFDVLPATQGERAGTTVVSTLQDVTVQRITGYKAEKPIKWDAGETWFAAWKKDGDRAGIFLRAGVDPDGNDPNVFLLGAPDGNQPAKYWLLNTRRDDVPPDNAVLVLPPQIRYVMTGRHDEYVVLGQAGGGKDGRKPVVGRFIDTEVQRAGIKGKLVKKDPQAKNTAQANYLARKLCAEERRANRSFVYTIPRRHTMPLIDNPSARGIVAPDVVVHVRDDEHGINGPMWVERVQHHSSVRGGTYTAVTLIDPTDLVFGQDEPSKPVPQTTKPKRHRRR